jgi:hypothetical protein
VINARPVRPDAVATGSRTRLPRRARWGGSINGLVATIALVAGLGAASIVITPRVLWAGSGEPSAQPAREPAHREALEQLAALIGRSHAVLAMHDRSASHFVEVVLWIEDASNPGVIDSEELAVISHSDIMRTITFYAIDDDEAGDGLPGDWSADATASVPATISPAAVTEPSFCARWRRSRLVASRVLMTNISDLRVNRVVTDEREGERLRIELIWPPDSSDAGDYAWLELELGPRDHSSVED